MMDYISSKASFLFELDDVDQRKRQLGTKSQYHVSGFSPVTVRVSTRQQTRKKVECRRVSVSSWPFS